MSSSLVPSSSAAHGITLSQNVARDVAEHIDEMRRGTARAKVAAVAGVMAPLAVTVALGVSGSVFGAIMFAYFSVMFAPIGAAVHHYRKKALKQADGIDRTRDISWVSRKDGLVFFNDDGIYIEKRGGFRPYGANERRFDQVAVEHGRLTLHGHDSMSGATYSLDVMVPPEWSDADTLHVRAKVDAFVTPTASSRT